MSEKFSEEQTSIDAVTQSSCSSYLWSSLVLYSRVNLIGWISKLWLAKKNPSSQWNCRDFGQWKKNKMADENETMPLCEEVFRLPSPPKPTRMIQSEGKPSQPVKEFVQNTSSLPALAGEVAVAQKNQVLRLEKRMEFLQNLQVLRNIFVDFFITNFVVTFLCCFLLFRSIIREGKVDDFVSF